MGPGPKKLDSSRLESGEAPELHAREEGVLTGCNVPKEQRLLQSDSFFDHEEAEQHGATAAQDPKAECSSNISKVDVLIKSKWAINYILNS